MLNPLHARTDARLTLTPTPLTPPYKPQIGQVYLEPGDPYGKVVSYLRHGEVILSTDFVQYAGQSWVRPSRLSWGCNDSDCAPNFKYSPVHGSCHFESYLLKRWPGLSGARAQVQHLVDESKQGLWVGEGPQEPFLGWSPCALQVRAINCSARGAMTPPSLRAALTPGNPCVSATLSLAAGQGFKWLWAEDEEQLAL